MSYVQLRGKYQKLQEELGDAYKRTSTDLQTALELEEQYSAKPTISKLIKAQQSELESMLNKSSTQKEKETEEYSIFKVEDVVRYLTPKRGQTTVQILEKAKKDGWKNLTTAQVSAALAWAATIQDKPLAKKTIKDGINFYAKR